MTLTVSQLIREIRINTKLVNTTQISDQTILDYVNIFFTQDLPQEIQLLAYKTVYQFTTQPLIDKYVFPANQYSTIFGQVIVAGAFVSTYFNYDLFQAYWVLNNQTRTQQVGNGSSSYSFIMPFPMIRGYTDFLGVLYPAVFINSVDLGGNDMVITDNGVGGLLNASGGDAGTVDYATGVTNVTFPSPTTKPIYSNVQTSTIGIPTACLFYNNTFTFRCVPDKSYLVQVSAYVNPAAYASLPGGYDAPIIMQNMFKYLAYGTARYILLEYKDLSQLEIINQLYKEQENMLLRISTRQRYQERTPTIFTVGAGGPLWGTNPPYSQ